MWLHRRLVNNYKTPPPHSQCSNENAFLYSFHICSCGSRGVSQQALLSMLSPRKLKEVSRLCLNGRGSAMKAFVRTLFFSLKSCFSWRPFHSPLSFRLKLLPYRGEMCKYPDILCVHDCCQSWLRLTVLGQYLLLWKYYMLQRWILYAPYLYRLYLIEDLIVFFRLPRGDYLHWWRTMLSCLNVKGTGCP